MIAEAGNAPGEPGFNDQFSSVADGYVRYRPTYPDRLFAWLATLVPDRGLAWDCATGSGQAAQGLARHFDRVVATDASAAQLGNARPDPRIEYRQAPAHASGLPDRSAALVTVAQALHWLDLGSFWPEARRVARPGGVVAVWCYSGVTIDPAVDPLIRTYYRDVVGPHWAPERILVDEGYRSVVFPFPEITAPPFEIAVEWTLADLEGYLRSWSASASYRKAHGEDPVARVHPALEAAWGRPDDAKPVRWPLHVRVGRVPLETDPDGAA